MGSLSVSLNFQSAAYGFLIALVLYGSLAWPWLIVGLLILIEVPDRYLFGFSWGDKSGFKWLKGSDDPNGEAR